MSLPVLRVQGWMAALGLPVVAAVPALLSLGHGMSFWSDDWDYVTTLHTQGLSLFRPYGQHWYAVPDAIWWVLLSTAGLRSYVPYLAVLLAMHVATCLVLFLLLRRRASTVVAFVSMAVLLFIGHGTVIFWAIMITYLGSTLCGLLALLLLDGPATDWRRVTAAAALLLMGMASSGMGLGFLVAAAVELALDRDRRRYLAALLLPAVGFVTWFALFGVHTTQPQMLGLPWQTASGYAEFVLAAVLAGTASVFGLPAVAWPIAVGLFAVTLALTRRVDLRSLGVAVGLLVQFTLVAIVRSDSGVEAASQPRYVYVATIYALLLLAPAATRVFAARWPWRAAPTALAVWAVAVNFCSLTLNAQAQRETTAFQSAELQTVDAFRGAPDLRQNADIDDDMPTVSTYFALTASLGSPVARVSQAEVDQLPGAAVDRALSRVLGIRSSAGTAPPAGAACQEAAMAAVLTGSSGRWLLVGAAPGTRLQLFPWLLEGSQPAPTATLTTPASGWEAIELPRTAQAVIWHLRIQASEPIQVCSPA